MRVAAEERLAGDVFQEQADQVDAPLDLDPALAQACDCQQRDLVHLHQQVAHGPEQLRQLCSLDHLLIGLNQPAGPMHLAQPACHSPKCRLLHDQFGEVLLSGRGDLPELAGRVGADQHREQADPGPLDPGDQVSDLLQVSLVVPIGQQQHGRVPVAVQARDPRGCD